LDLHFPPGILKAVSELRMTTEKWGLAGLVLILIFLNGIAAAEEVPPKKGSFNIQFENDVMDPGASDRHYTNGLLFSYHTGENQVWPWLDGWARRHYFLDPDVRLYASLAVGHNLYTPEDISTTELVLDDRPYAGWLHVDLGLVGQTDDVLRTMQISLGIVGPAAKGEEFQKWIHRVISSPEPMGWDNQLNNELALMLVFEQKWRNLSSPGFLSGLGLDIDLSPHGSVAVGNVFTYGGVGGTVRLGQGLERDFGPPRIQPAPPGSGFCAPRGGFAWYLFGGLDGRLMLHNIFLDGNIFSDSHSVEKNYVVGDLVGGAAVSGLGMRLSFTYVVRSPEFEEQSSPDRFGSLTLSFHF
jgi:lipid A 3-O-deacylase